MTTGWGDILALVATITVFAGVVYGILFITRQVSAGVQSTKQKLKEQGLHVSDSGLSIKTSKRFNREDYVDATQRGLVKAMESASYGTADKQAPLIPNSSSSLAPPPTINRKSSSSSVSASSSSDEAKKSRSFFRKKKD